MKTRFYASAAALVVPVVLAGAAVAQTPGATTPPDAASAQRDTAEMGEIIVTAQKRSELLRDVPMSVAAATGEQLQARGITSTEDLGKLVPGFSFQKGTYGLPVYYIRGVGFSDTAIGATPAVTIYTDQVPIPYGTMARGAVLDLERVEVLKGPQGTLFGQNSTGGAINYIAAKPTNTLNAGFNLGYGRFNAVNAEAFVSGPLTSTLSMRVAVRHEYQSAWQKSYVSNDEIGRRDFTNGRVIVDWEPSSAVKFELSATGWNDKSDLQRPQFVAYTPLQPVGPGLPGAAPGFPISTFPAAPNDPRAAAWNPDRSYALDDWFYQLALRGDINLTDAITLTSLTSYARSEVHNPTDMDASIYPIVELIVHGKIKSFAQELRLAGDMDRVKWMLGGNYQHDQVDEIIDDQIDNSTASHIGPIDFNGYLIEDFQKIDTYSAFGSLEYQLTDQLSAQGSVRYTKQNRDFAGCSRDNGNGQIAAAFSALSSLLSGTNVTIPPGACVTIDDATGLPLPTEQPLSLDEDNLSWRGSLNWKPNSVTLLYANVTKGYKAGSFPTIPAVLASQQVGIKQESVLAYEVGTKLSLLDRKVQLEAAAFYYDYRDKQLQGYRVVPLFGPLPGLVNVPKSRVLGAELGVTVHPAEGLRISANGSFIDTKVKSNPVTPFGPFGDTADFRGQSFPFTPRWQGVVDAQYEFPVLADVKLFLGAAVSGRTKTTGVLLTGQTPVSGNEAPLKIPGYALLDVRGGVNTTSNVRVEVWGRNIFNKFYLNNTTRIGDFINRYTGMPATYGVTLSYKFR